MIKYVNKMIDNVSVVDGTIELSSEPFHSLIFGDSMFGSNGGFTSSSKSNSAACSFQNDVEIHTEDTSEWIILNTQINVFLNTEAETSGVRKVYFSELSVLNFKSSFENFVGFVASDCNVSSHFFVSLDTETSDGESSS